MPLAATDTSEGVIRLRVSMPSVRTTSAVRCGSPPALRASAAMNCAASPMAS